MAHPTDAKLRRKIIERIHKMGDEGGVKWDRFYRFTVPKLLRVIRTRLNNMVKSRRKAERKLKMPAGRLVREFQRKASRGWNLIGRDELELFERVLAQGGQDKNKIYSLYDTTVQCIGKGKAHKMWEFGRKASVEMTRDHGITVGAVSFEENIWDGETLDWMIIQSRMVPKSPSGVHFLIVVTREDQRCRACITTLAGLPGY